MTIKDKATVAQYTRQHQEILAAIENLKEFIETMPAPDDAGHIPNVGYGYTGSVGRIWELLKRASEVADEMSEVAK